MFSRISLVAVTAALTACGGSPKVGTTEITSAGAEPVAVRVSDAARIVRGGVADNGHKIPITTAAYATCVAVVPGAIRAGVVPPGDHQGVVSCRKGNRWSTPGFFLLSTGPTARRVDPGAQDLVMLIDAEDGQATFGGDERAGHHVMTCYAHGKGEFKGVELGGVVVKPDPASMRRYYGQERGLGEVLTQPAQPGAAAGGSGSYPGVIGDTFGWARSAFLGVGP